MIMITNNPVLKIIIIIVSIVARWLWSYSRFNFEHRFYCSYTESTCLQTIPLTYDHGSSIGVVGALYGIYQYYCGIVRPYTLIFMVFIYIALLLCFIRKNVVSMAKKNPKPALLTLNQQLSDGLISEEEYQNARKKVLIKL